jgi:hypothetical protein
VLPRRGSRRHDRYHAAVVARFVEATMPELVRYDAMCRAIDACYRVDEIKKIRDQHLALQAVARVAQNFDAERKAAVIRIRAERKGGELLRRMRERGERDAGRGGDRRSPSARTRVIPNLADMGISYDQSSRWQQLSEVPQEEFEADMAAILAGEERPSTTRIIRELGTRRGEHADRSVLRRINGRVQSDLWTNRLPQLFGSEPSEITLDPGVDLFQRAQEFLRTDVAIIKHILAVSTLLPDKRYWPGNNPGCSGASTGRKRLTTFCNIYRRCLIGMRSSSTSC